VERRDARARRSHRAAGFNPTYVAPHIRVPKLIVQGRYDEDTPLKTYSEPFFKLLSPPKQLFLYEGGHVPPSDVLMAATRDWLDQQLGPVRR
jgi:pimeloyl-ACP methyl ester carboxylesterase